MHRFCTFCSLITILFFSGTVFVQAGNSVEAPTGLWANEKRTVAVKISSCPEQGKLCGRIAWLKKPYDDDGSLKRDNHNPEPELRDQGLCNLQILSGFSRYGDNRWENGRIYNPEEGQTYSASLELVSEDELRVRGYVFLPIFGKTQVWHRLSSAPGECPAGSEQLSPVASGG